LNSQLHQPVLLAEVLALVPREARLIADLTLGLGGHSEAILKQVGGEAELLAFERDLDSLELGKEQLSSLPNRVNYFHDSYANIDDRLGQEYRGKLDFTLMDLGLSSQQLEASGRGFSFMRLEEPLDLRFDATSGEPISERLKRTEVDELTGVLKRYGEVRRARIVANAILRVVAVNQLKSVGDLVRVLEPFARSDRRNKFFAKCWQALRIWHNSELEMLEVGLEKQLDYVKPDGVMAVISFHSLEDRMVKDFFLRQENPCICPPRLPQCVCGRKATLRRVNRRPIVPGEVEIAGNPRARSAKLRAARRLLDS
jgi:16S rRNA (cytosine1402-N4)-methyltransferase